MWLCSSSHKEVGTFLESSLQPDLVKRMQQKWWCDSSKFVPFYSRSEPCHHHDDKPRLTHLWIRDYMEPSWFGPAQAILNQPAPSWPTRWPQTHEQTQARSAKLGLDQQNPPPTCRLMRNYKLCCFTPLDYGVVCYTGIANWYKMQAGLKPRSYTFCSLDSFLYSIWISHVFLNNPSLQRWEKCQCHPGGIG